MIINGCFLTTEGYMVADNRPSISVEQRHYVRVEIDPTTHKRVVYYVQEFFRQSDYLRAQIEWVKRDLLNRCGVMEKYGWSEKRLEEEIARNPGIMLEHFTDYNGDNWFRDKIRPSYIETVSQELKNADVRCLSHDPRDFCGECDICVVVHRILPIKMTPVRKLVRKTRIVARRALRPMAH
jgi:hypothetical protein